MFTFEELRQINGPNFFSPSSQFDKAPAVVTEPTVLQPSPNIESKKPVGSSDYVAKKLLSNVGQAPSHQSSVKVSDASTFPKEVLSMGEPKRTEGLQSPSYHYNRTSYYGPSSSNDRSLPSAALYLRSLSMEQLLLGADTKEDSFFSSFEAALGRVSTSSTIPDEPLSPESETDPLCPFSPTGRSRFDIRKLESSEMQREIHTYSSVGSSISKPTALGTFGRWKDFINKRNAVGESDTIPLRDQCDQHSFTSSYSTQGEDSSSPKRNKLRMTFQNSLINFDPESHSSSHRFEITSGTSTNVSKSQTNWNTLKKNKKEILKNNNEQSSPLKKSSISKKISQKFKGTFKKSLTLFSK
ncbi:hypothetical protein O181_026739 [Austropuccinia psidii MF-1]|uniref:Uncharacterized protein n=1 Tax=Austropuccinia psidii MF-1 TaxID=1389203 RepID=A0A9Q3CMU4_9BASI|nr:hypothetical protein [Austropuccinia psidii MF-1]